MKSLEFMWAGGNTKRYHTAKTIAEDTVGHHSYNVACIIMYLWPDASARLLRAALKHDMAEHKTGDMPAPMKRKLPDYVDYENDGERVSFRTVYGQAEDTEMLLAGVRLENLTHEESWLLKYADALDGMRFCIQERCMGNQRIKEVYSNFKSYVELLIQEAPASLVAAAQALYGGLAAKWREADGR